SRWRRSYQGGGGPIKVEEVLSRCKKAEEVLSRWRRSYQGGGGPIKVEEVLARSYQGGGECFLSPGAWVTATDLPEIIGNLRANLLRNTRGRCRYTPQAAALSWGPDVERTYPRSVYRYDYVLAADVVYHHDYLEELLFTMRYFCRPGTTLIWANKVRFPTDLVFTEDFKNTFNTTLLAEMGEVKIFKATCRETEDHHQHHPAG
ncbi:unnamed protein product, partial [Oncorhynchus mykiss]